MLLQFIKQPAIIFALVRCSFALIYSWCDVLDYVFVPLLHSDSEQIDYAGLNDLYLF
jgi:hypothetical protein